MRIKTHGSRYYVYIVTDKKTNLLQPGATGDVEYRMARLRQSQELGMRDDGSCTQLIYWEMFDDAMQAVARSEEIAKWSRRKTEALIETTNPTWRSLNEEVYNMWAALARDSLLCTEEEFWIWVLLLFQEKVN